MRNELLNFKNMIKNDSNSEDEGQSKKKGYKKLTGESNLSVIETGVKQNLCETEDDTSFGKLVKIKQVILETEKEIKKELKRDKKPLNEPEKIENCNNIRPTVKSKVCRNDLDKLHDDINEMLMGEKIISAGSMCNSIQENLNLAKRSDFSNILVKNEELSLPVSKKVVSVSSPNSHSCKIGKRKNMWTSGIIQKKARKGDLSSEVDEMNEEYELSDYIEHDKKYFFVNLTKISCKLCSFKGKFIVQHYRMSHPESEMLISRINPDVTEILIEDAVRNHEEYDKDHLELEQMMCNFKCPFCLMLIKDTANTYYNHISSHTGEYCFHCNHCSYWTYNHINIHSHLNKMHYNIQKTAYKMVYLDPKISKYIFGYICSECNFIQLIRKTVEEHAMVYHPGTPKIHKVNLGVLLCDDVDENHVNDTHSNLNCIKAVKSEPGETHDHNLKISIEAKEPSDLLVQKEKLEVIKVKIEPNKLDDNPCPIELTTFICQPDLDIKQDFENDRIEMFDESKKIQRENKKPRNISEEIQKLNGEVDSLKQLEKTKKTVEAIEIGPISVIKEFNIFTFQCKIQNCNYSSKDKKAFAVHCEIIHKDFFHVSSTGECNICSIKFEYKGKFVTVYDVYLHIVTRHKDFLEPESPINIKLMDDVPSVLEPPLITSNITSLGSKSDKSSVDSPLPLIPLITEDTESQSLEPKKKHCQLVSPYSCKDDGFPSCSFKTLYFDEYLKHVEAIHQVDGLGSFPSEHELQREAVMEGWLVKEVGPFQCGYCKKATVTHQEMERHQGVFHAQDQYLFYYRKFVPNDIVIVPEQVNLEDPSFINHIIHLPSQIHLCDFKLTNGLFSSTSAKLTNGSSEVSLPLQSPPTRDTDTERDQLSVSLDEPEELKEPDLPYLDDARVTTRKLQCKWKGCFQTKHSQTTLVKHIEMSHIQFLTPGKGYACFWVNCPRKSKPFTTKRNLLIHMRVHNGEKPHKCSFQSCNKAFSQLGNLKTHQRIHTGERPYLCQFPNCFKSFPNKANVVKHQSTHYDTVKPYACQVTGCSKKYTGRQNLQRHIKSHSMPKKYSNSSDTLQCKWKDCYQTCDTQTAFVKHIETNHIKIQKGEKFTCFWNNCPKKSEPYTAKGSLRIHMRAHTGEKPYKCVFQGCDKAFARLADLNFHNGVHTSERPYLCQFSNCAKGFFTIATRNRHQERIHRSFKPYACQVTGCLKRYTNPTGLRIHMKRHTVDEQRKAKWKLVENRNKHQKAHNDTLQCKWKGCNQTYDSQTTLVKHIENNHIYSQSGEEFTCFWKNCPRRLKPLDKRSNLLTHMRVHSGEKPYKCSFQGCNKAFPRSDKLKDHQRTHTKAYACQVTDSSKKDAERSSIQKHLENQMVDEQLMVKSIENRQKEGYNTCNWKGCYQTYDFQMALVNHIAESHVESQSGKKFICFWNNCPRKLKPFPNKWLLAIHIRVHSGEKPYKCTFQGCNKSYKHLNNLKFHQKSHTKKKTHSAFNIQTPHACQVPGCSKTYAYRSSVYHHMKKHAIHKKLEVNQKSVENEEKENDFIIYHL